MPQLAAAGLRVQSPTRFRSWRRPGRRRRRDGVRPVTLVSSRCGVAAALGPRRLRRRADFFGFLLEISRNACGSALLLGIGFVRTGLVGMRRHSCPIPETAAPHTGGFGTGPGAHRVISVSAPRAPIFLRHWHMGGEAIPAEHRSLWVGRSARLRPECASPSARRHTGCRQPASNGRPAIRPMGCDPCMRAVCPELKQSDQPRLLA